MKSSHRTFLSEKEDRQGMNTHGVCVYWSECCLEHSFLDCSFGLVSLLPHMVQFPVSVSLILLHGWRLAGWKNFLDFSGVFVLSLHAVHPCLPSKASWSARLLVCGEAGRWWVWSTYQPCRICILVCLCPVYYIVPWLPLSGEVASATFGSTSSTLFACLFFSLLLLVPDMSTLVCIFERNAF